MTEGQTPAGWYDDGQGQLRWWDGAGWTEHTHPLPTPAPAAAAPAAQAPAQQVAPAAAGAAAGAAGGYAAAQAQPAAAVPAQTVTPGAAQPRVTGWDNEDLDIKSGEPFYKKRWFIPVVIIAVLVAGLAAYLLTKSDSSGTTGTGGSTPTASAPAASTPAATGAVAGNASAVAARAGCTVNATVPPAAASTATAGVEPTQRVLCTLGGATYTVVSWTNAADQAAAGSLAKAFTPPITPGTKYYATGTGWVAFDSTYSQAGATAFATPADGTVKGVVVVSGSSTAPSAAAS